MRVQSTTLDNDVAFAKTVGATCFGLKNSQKDLISLDLRVHHVNIVRLKRHV